MGDLQSGCPSVFEDEGFEMEEERIVVDPFLLVTSDDSRDFSESKVISKGMHSQDAKEYSSTILGNLDNIYPSLINYHLSYSYSIYLKDLENRVISPICNLAARNVDKALTQALEVNLSS